jgi:hypothetical protein
LSSAHTQKSFAQLQHNGGNLSTNDSPWAYAITSPDVFQEKMSELLNGLDTVRVYLDDILHVTKGSWQEQLEVLDQVFNHLRQAGLKVNAKKSSFGAHELQYLGYKITRTGIMPITKKIKAIQAIKAPRTRKQLRGFVGMINFYRDV